MDRTTVTLILVICLSILGLPPVTTLAGPATRPTTQPFDEVMAQIAVEQSIEDTATVRTLQLSPEQSERMLAIAKAYDASVLALREKYKEQLIPMMQAVREMESFRIQSQGRADPEMLLNMIRPYESFYRERLDLMVGLRRKLMACLTPEQRLQWESLNIRRGLDQGGLTKAQLSPEQETQVKSLCDAAAERVVALGENRTRKALFAIERGTVQLCAKQILTKEQRHRLGFPWADMYELLREQAEQQKH